MRRTQTSEAYRKYVAKTQGLVCPFCGSDHTMVDKVKISERHFYTFLCDECQASWRSSQFRFDFLSDTFIIISIFVVGTGTIASAVSSFLLLLKSLNPGVATILALLIAVFSLALYLAICLGVRYVQYLYFNYVWYKCQKTFPFDPYETYEIKQKEFYIPDEAEVRYWQNRIDKRTVKHV